MNEAIENGALVMATKRYSTKQIKYYLAGLMFDGIDDNTNDALDLAISLIDDYEDGIEAVLERKRLYERRNRPNDQK